MRERERERERSSKCDDLQSDQDYKTPQSWFRARKLQKRSFFTAGTKKVFFHAKIETEAVKSFFFWSMDPNFFSVRFQRKTDVFQTWIFH